MRNNLSWCVNLQPESHGTQGLLLQLAALLIPMESKTCVMFGLQFVSDHHSIVNSLEVGRITDLFFTDPSNSLMQQPSLKEGLVLTAPHHSAHVVRRPQDPVRLLRQVDAAHRCHVVDVVVARRRVCVACLLVPNNSLDRENLNPKSQKNSRWDRTWGAFGCGRRVCGWPAPNRPGCGAG